jgi:predicted acylesterase/phospholipase RssA
MVNRLFLFYLLFSTLELLPFLNSTAGRSALLLSGGATLGMYHLGVVKALHAQHLLPRVISGSSVGAIIASLVCTASDDRLTALFDAPHWNLTAFGSSEKLPGRRLWRFIQRGFLLDVKVLQRCLRENLGDLTFREAFDISGRVLNITVSGK